MSLSPRVRVFAVAALCAVVLATLGRWATQLGPWYAALAKPPWQPPDFWFGPVWTLIYTLSVWSAAGAWLATDEQRQRRALVVAWAVNMVLNLLWSWLFFTRQRPDWAQLEVVALWLSVLAVMVVTWRISRLHGALLLPYLAWVAFAAVLNRAIVQLNPIAG